MIAGKEVIIINIGGSRTSCQGLDIAWRWVRCGPEGQDWAPSQGHFLGQTSCNSQYPRM